MGLRGVIQRNFWAKFLSFVVAFLVWLSIYTSQTKSEGGEDDGKIPVSDEPAGALPNVPAAPLAPLNPLVPNKTTPANAMVKSDPFSRPVAILKPPGDGYSYEVSPTEIEIVVQGEKEQLMKMDTTAIRVFVDITDVLEKFGTAKQHDGIPVLVEVHTPTTVALSTVEPRLATVKRIPAPEPVTKPAPPTVTSASGEGASTNAVDGAKSATNATPASSAAEKGAQTNKSAPPIPESKTSDDSSDAGKEPEPATPRGDVKDKE